MWRTSGSRQLEGKAEERGEMILNILDQWPLSVQVLIVDYSQAMAFLLCHTASLPGKDVSGWKIVLKCIQMSLKGTGSFVQDLDNLRYGTHQPLGTESKSLMWRISAPSTPTKSVSQLSGESHRALFFMVQSLQVYNAQTLPTHRRDQDHEFH